MARWLEAVLHGVTLVGLQSKKSHAAEKEQHKQHKKRKASLSTGEVKGVTL